MPKASSADTSSISNLESRISNHSIYTGPFAALEIRCMEIIAELQRGDPLREVNILIGSNVLASYLKRRLAENGRTIANVRFHTFLDLTARLAAASESTPGKPRLPRLGASILLENILSENLPPAYASLSAYQGFRDALLETFRDLRDAGFSAKELDSVVEAGNRAQDRQEHLRSFAALYRRFREQTGRFHDVDDDFRAAVRNVSESKTFPGFSQLLIYGIYDATEQQSHFLSALKKSVEMAYFIPFVDEAISDFARPFLETRIEELGVQPIRLQAEPPVKSLEHLAAMRFGFSGEPAGREGVPADGSFSLISVPGESRMAIEIVREVLRAVRDGTIRGFHEAAVILRHPENDLPILSEMLRLRGVPYFVHGGRSFADRLLCKAIQALLNLASNSFSREAVLTAMELVAAALPESTSPAWDVHSWRALTNDPRFLGGLNSWDSGTESLAEQTRREVIWAETHSANDAEEEAESRVPSIPVARKHYESARLLQSAWKLLRQAAADWPEALTWMEWAGFLERRLEPLLGSTADWNNFSNILDELGGLRALDGFEGGDSKFEIRSSGKTEQGESISAEKMKSALLQSVATLSYPEGRFQRSGINLLSTSAARGLRFPLVIIPGLDEGRFPAKLRQDPFLPDSERVRMKGLPIKSRRFEEEKLLFDMAARSAEKRLVLMTSRLEESSDRERIPSQFFLRVCAAIQGGVVSIRDLTQGNVPGFRSISLDNPALAEDEVPVDEGEIRLRLIAGEQDSARMALEALAQLDPFRLAGPLAFDRARWTHQLTRFDGHLTHPRLVEWMASNLGPSAGQVSASRMEEYAKCPYFFFLKRGMDLESWKERGQLEGIDPLERGLIVHRILEGFLREYCGEKFLAASEEELRHALESLAYDTLEKARLAGVPDLLWEIERDVLLVMLKNWLEFEKKRAGVGMLPTQLEQAFGDFTPAERHPSYCVTAGRHRFDFRGRIDRVDVSRDGTRARVIDYKTGTLPESMAGSSRTPLMSGERIQLAIYKGALSILKEFQAVKKIEGEYLHLQPKDARIVPSSFTDEELERASQALPDILEVLGDCIESGIFFARTSGMIRPSGHCDFCDYLTICGKDRVQREARKANDPAVRRFLRIVELSS